MSKGAIAKCSRELRDFVSTVFTRHNKNGFFRNNLNSKDLHKFVQYRHFKMESFLDVLKCLDDKCWSKRYFSIVPINESHQKFKFELEQKVYKFVGMPNVYSDVIRIFTKILKPVHANLFLLMNCICKVIPKLSVRECGNYLGFNIHETKSVSKPTQRIGF